MDKGGGHYRRKGRHKGRGGRQHRTAGVGINIPIVKNNGQGVDING